MELTSLKEKKLKKGFSFSGHKLLNIKYEEFDNNSPEKKHKFQSDYDIKFKERLSYIPHDTIDIFSSNEVFRKREAEMQMQTPPTKKLRKKIYKLTINLFDSVSSDTKSRNQEPKKKPIIKTRLKDCSMSDRSHCNHSNSHFIKSEAKKVNITQSPSLYSTISSSKESKGKLPVNLTITPKDHKEIIRKNPSRKQMSTSILNTTSKDKFKIRTDLTEFLAKKKLIK